jgi:hypothetical protein
MQPENIDQGRMKIGLIWVEVESQMEPDELLADERASRILGTDDV